MRVMKPTQDLLSIQRKLLNLLIIHTVAPQQCIAVGVPYRAYPISESLLCKQIWVHL